MTRLNTYRILISAVCLVLAVPAGAGMYKWTDDQGNTHYSQVPPNGRETREIAPPPRVKPQPTGDRAREQPDQSISEESEEPTLTREQQKQQDQLNRRNCEAAKKNLKLFQTARRVMENGELVIITEEDRAKRLEETRKQIEEFCNP